MYAASSLLNDQPTRPSAPNVNIGVGKNQPSCALTPQRSRESSERSASGAFSATVTSGSRVCAGGGGGGGGGVSSAANAKGDRDVDNTRTRARCMRCLSFEDELPGSGPAIRGAPSTAAAAGKFTVTVCARMRLPAALTLLLLAACTDHAKKLK